jgi:hypothetical protein
MPQGLIESFFSTSVITNKKRLNKSLSFFWPGITSFWTFTFLDSKIEKLEFFFPFFGKKAEKQLKNKKKICNKSKCANLGLWVKVFQFPRFTNGTCSSKVFSSFNVFFSSAMF